MTFCRAWSSFNIFIEYCAERSSNFGEVQNESIWVDAHIERTLQLFVIEAGHSYNSFYLGKVGFQLFWGDFMSQVDQVNSEKNSLG